MLAPAPADLDRRIRALAEDLRQAGEQRDWQRVAELDAHLPALITEDSLAAALDTAPDAGEDLRQALQVLADVHRATLALADAHRTELGEALRQLQQEHEAIDAYADVLRHSW